MRVHTETPTWKLAANTLVDLAIVAAFMVSAFEEHWRAAVIFGFLAIAASVENARDRILDRLDGGRA